MKDLISPLYVNSDYLLSRLDAATKAKSFTKSKQIISSLRREIRTARNNQLFLDFKERPKA